MPNLGPMELLLIFAIVIVLFGAKKIPEIAKGLGQGIRQFKQAHAGIETEDKKKENLEAQSKKESES